MIRDTDSLRMLAASLAAKHCKPAGAAHDSDHPGGMGSSSTRRYASHVPHSYSDASALGSSPAAQQRSRHAPHPAPDEPHVSKSMAALNTLNRVPRRPPPPTDLGQSTPPPQEASHRPGVQPYLPDRHDGLYDRPGDILAMPLGSRAAPRTTATVDRYSAPEFQRYSSSRSGSAVQHHRDEASAPARHPNAAVAAPSVEREAPRPTRQPPPVPTASADDVSWLWAMPASREPTVVPQVVPLVAADRAAPSRGEARPPMLVSPPRRSVLLPNDDDDARALSPVTPSPTRFGAGNDHTVLDTSAVGYHDAVPSRLGRSTAAPGPAAAPSSSFSIGQPNLLHSTTTSSYGANQRNTNHTIYGGTSRQGQQPQVSRMSLLQEQADVEYDRSEKAAKSRVDDVVRRVSDHQNAHVKLRAQLTLELDRCRWESDQADFRLAELQATVEGVLHALRDRIKSRVATVTHLRTDACEQLEHSARADIGGLLKERQHDDRAALRKRHETVETLSVTTEQLQTHVDLQIAALQHELTTQGSHDVTSRLAVAKQAVMVAARQEKQGVDAITAMMSEFAAQTKLQLEELRAEREHFEKRLTQRVQELSEIDSRRAPPPAAQRR